MLKFIVKDIDKVEEAHRGFYEEDGNGNYVLKVEGAVPKAQLDTFRENNVKLKEKIEKFEGIDPEKVDDFIDAHTKISSGKYTKKDGKKGKEVDVDAVVAERVKQMKEEHATELGKRDDQITTLSGKLSKVKINSKLLEAGAEAGLRKSATEDLLARGNKEFSLDKEGNLVALDDDGNPKYGKAGEPLTPQEFVNGLAENAPHLFDPNEGTGSGGSGGGGGGGGENPWKKDSFNMTKQALMIKENPSQAKRMATQAGVTLNLPNS